MRGSLIFAFLAEVRRYDPAGVVAHGDGFDADFKEPVLLDRDDDGLGERVRAEHPPVRIPCQVETQEFEAERMYPAGNAPSSKLTLVFHFKDLERLGLVDALTGEALIRTGDRLAGIYDKAGRLVQATRTPSGLYATEVRPIGFGLHRAGPTRNLLLVQFDEHRTAAPRES